MAKTNPFTDAISGESFTLESDDVYYIMSVGTGTLIMMKNRTSYVVTTPFACVCRELGYCEED